MIKIRRGTFETNSSSTHSITICDKNMYDKFIRGEDVYYDCCADRLITKEEALIKLDKYNHDCIKYNRSPIGLDEYIKDIGIWDVLDYESYRDYVEDQYETFEEQFKTPSGDVVVAFGYFGYDG